MGDAFGTEELNNVFLWKSVIDVRNASSDTDLPFDTEVNSKLEKCNSELERLKTLKTQTSATGVKDAEWVALKAKLRETENKLKDAEAKIGPKPIKKTSLELLQEISTLNDQLQILEYKVNDPNNPLSLSDEIRISYDISDLKEKIKIAEDRASLESFEDDVDTLKENILNLRREKRNLESEIEGQKIQCSLGEQYTEMFKKDNEEQQEKIAKHLQTIQDQGEKIQEKDDVMAAMHAAGLELEFQKNAQDKKISDLSTRLHFLGRIKEKIDEIRTALTGRMKDKDLELLFNQLYALRDDRDHLSFEQIVEAGRFKKIQNKFAGKLNTLTAKRDRITKELQEIDKLPLPLTVENQQRKKDLEAMKQFLDLDTIEQINEFNFELIDDDDDDMSL